MGRRIIAKLMALCMVLTSVLPSIPAAAAEAPKSYSVILEESKHGKMAFFPEEEEKSEEHEVERSYTEGDDVFLSISPEEGYVLSDVAFYEKDVEIKDGKVETEDAKEKEVKLFTVEEKDDTLGIQAIDDDLKVLATYEKGELDKEETIASHIVKGYEEKIAKMKSEEAKDTEKTEEEKPEEKKEQASEAKTEAKVADDKAPEVKSSEEKAEETKTEEVAEEKTTEAAKEETSTESADTTEELKAEETADIPQEVTTVTNDGEKVPVVDDTANVKENENLSKEDVAKESLQEEKDLKKFVDGKINSGYTIFVRYSFVDSARADRSMKLKDYTGENQDKLLDVLVTNQDEILSLYEVENDDKYYYAYPNINGKKGNITFIDMDAAYNNEQAEMIDNFNYDKNTGILKISKEYFTKEAFKDYDGAPIIKSQFLLAYDAGESSQAGVTVHIKNERSDVKIVNEDQVVLSDVLDCQISIPVATPETADKINIANLSITANGAEEPLKIEEDKMLYDENGVLTQVGDIMTLRSVDITIMNDEWDYVDLEKFNAKTTTSITNLAAVKTGDKKTPLVFEEDIPNVASKSKYTVKAGLTYVGPDEALEDGVNTTWGKRIASMKNYLYGANWSSDSDPHKKLWQYIYDGKSWASGGTELHKYASSYTMADEWAGEDSWEMKWKNYRFMLHGFKKNNNHPIDWTQLNKAFNEGIDGKGYFPLACTSISSSFPSVSKNGEGSFDERDVYLRVVYVNEAKNYFLLGMATPGMQGTKTDDDSVYQAGYGIYKFQYQASKKVKIKKKTANSDITDNNAMYASLAGATYGIYPTQADAENGTNVVETVTIQENGESEEKEIAKGTYYIKELNGPTAGGYAVNTEIKDVTVADEDVEFEMEEVPQSADIDLLLQKLDKTTLEATPEGNGTLAGAQFTVKYFDNTDNNTSGTAKRTWVLQTDANGQINLQNDASKVSGDAFYKNSAGRNTFPIGTYTIEETKAPTGYLLPTEKIKPIVISSSGTVEKIPDVLNEAINAEDDIKTGGISITKIDEDTKGTDMEGKGQGDADLSGIKFNIINRSNNPVKIGDKECAVGEICKTITTDANGKASTGDHDLPYGKYEVVEVGSDGLANNYYLLKNGDNSRTVDVEQDGVIVEIEEKFENPVIRGDVEVEKLDIETKARGPLGKATHVGTTFEITNRSKAAVKVDGNWRQPGEVVATIKIEEEKEPAKTTGKALPYGTYSIKETAVGEGYLLTDTRERTFQIREDGKTVSISKTGDVKDPFENQVKRGNMHFDKKILDIEGGQNKGMKNVPFLITSKTTGEKHVIVTDVNGNFDTDGYKHSEKTNANDELLSEDGKSITDPSKLDYEAGVWFGQDKDGNQTLKVDDNLCALPYDDYTLTELSAPVNAGTKMITEEFTIYRDQQSIDRGTFNDINRPEIGTVAKDGVTNENYGSNESEKIIDTVSYSGLTPGEEYTMKGELMDKATEEVVTVNGKKVTATKKFTPEAANGEVEIEFTFPKGALAGKEVVAFETCKLGGRTIVTHEDIEDAGQTVVYPGIKTTLIDGQTKTHYAYNDSTTLVDTVVYKNLKPDTEYTMKGTLMDKETGEPVKTEDGKEITAEQKFTPAERDGSVEITFTVPANLLISKSVVAFERCYQEDKEIAVHTDINDEAQTVNYPGIGTTAVDGASRTHYGLNSSDSIVDTVGFTNLEPGKEYTMKGILMDKETGEPIKDGDKTITSEKTFTPTDKDGSIDMEFTFTAGLLEGKTAVVFEECFLKGKTTTPDDQTDKQDTPSEKLIAEHKDINDVEQTVSYPVIRTTAKDVQTQGHYGANTSGQIVDTVSYTNLEVGKKYTMKGTLMDKETGNPVLDENNKEITAEVKFKPERANGTVDITLNVTPGILNGKSVVVFEECILEDETVVEHKDLEDEDQTVTYPEIGTTLLDEKTNEHVAANGEKVILIDTVSYSKLEVGREYTMTGTLMNKETGKAIKDGDKEITATQTFKPEQADGTVAMQFEVNTESLKGVTIVAFEKTSTVFETDAVVVASHEDIEDVAQTVFVPEISTTATDKATGNHSGKATKTVTINDEVKYKNLVPGKAYVMTGTLMDKATGKELKSKDGKTYTATKEFTPDKAEGTVTLSFKVPGSVVNGKSVVVFETCQYNKIDVAVHHDIKDKKQTVTYKKTKEKKDSKKSSSSSSSSSSGSKGSSISKVKTGDNMNMLILLAVGFVFLGAVAGKLVYDRRKRRV